MTNTTQERVAKWNALLDEMEEEYFGQEEGVREDDPSLGPGYDEDHATLKEIRAALALLDGEQEVVAWMRMNEDGTPWRATWPEEIASEHGRYTVRPLTYITQEEKK